MSDVRQQQNSNQIDSIDQVKNEAVFNLIQKIKDSLAEFKKAKEEKAKEEKALVEFKKALVKFPYLKDIASIPFDDEESINAEDLYYVRYDEGFNYLPLQDEIEEFLKFKDLYLERGIPFPREIVNGDQLRNINSYEYLYNIAEHIPQLPNAQKNIPVFERVAILCGPSSRYNPAIAYGDLYTQFLLEFEKQAKALIDEKERLDKQYIKNLHEYQNIFQISKDLSDAQLEAVIKLDEKIPEGIKIPEGVIIPEIPEGVRIYLRAMRSESRAISSAISLIYANPNLALERSMMMVRDVLKTTNHTSETEEKVRERLKGEHKTATIKADDINKITPQSVDEGPKKWFAVASAFIAGLTGVSGTFKPQATTSQASIRTYNYKNPENPENPVEYRFGTQGQYHEGTARANPAFEAWLNIQAPHPQNEIAHIYFNNLPIHSSSFFSGSLEVPLTKQLHALEEKHSNIAVITLPADHGILSKSKIGEHKRNILGANAEHLFLAIASGNSIIKVKQKVNARGRFEEKIVDLDVKKEFPKFDELSRDFKISDKVKTLLYGKGRAGVNETWNKAEEADKLRSLIAQSFDDLGFKTNQRISKAQLQAVYFHFLKYRLTDFIIQQLGPKSFNFACKDAIDRGGVSSAYYNLMKSIENGNPLSENEFYTALHGAPTLVKGRGMNHHVKIIWNAVDAYIDAKQVKGTGQNNIPDWLIKWRNEHAPKESRYYCVNQLKKYIADVDDKIKKGKKYKNTLFGMGVGVDLPHKLKAAEALLREINGEQVKYTDADRTALHNGELGKIRAKFESHKILVHKISEPGSHVYTNVWGPKC